MFGDADSPSDDSRPSSARLAPYGAGGAMDVSSETTALVPPPGQAAATGENAIGVPISFRDAFWTWTRIAALSFGGPAGQIAVMHRILVDEKRWIGDARFLH